MTLRQSLSAYYEELDKAFHLYWMEVLRNYGTETAHGLRVNLKRQNAFFHMLEALDERFNAGLAMDTFDAIYHRAGKVRNRQVERQLIEKRERRLHQIHRLSAWLEEKENRRAQLLREYELEHSMAPVRELSARVLSVIQHLNPENEMTRLRGYFLKLAQGIADFLRRSGIRGEELHDLRKFIKELFYNIEFLQRHFGLEVLQGRALAQLDEIQHVLGKWHDYDFTLLHLARKNTGADPSFIARLESEKVALEQQARGMFGGLEEAMLELEGEIKALLD